MDAALGQSWANVSAAACLALPTPDEQVACSAQQLNITDPPSIYDWASSSFLWTPVTCLLSNVTYSNRVDQASAFNYCTVPQEGNDAFLFAALALLAGACSRGKLAVVWVLVAGGTLGAATYLANLRELGNGVAMWLGISPPDLFFYAFIPPLALDSALRLDLFLLRKTWPHMLLTTFVMVIASAFLLTPIIMFAKGFGSRGFTWAHVALFSAMVASTDALSVTAILKKSGGPERLVTLMEGESLLNDASAITLFEVFKGILEAHADPAQPFPSVWSSLPDILLDTLRLAGIGAGVGLAVSIALGYLLRWLRWYGVQPASESVAALSCSFLAFYLANSPAGGSGVIAVVVFGLWGNFTRKWGMLAASEESGDFDAFWDACSLGANGLVFFWSGCACLNFLIRSAGMLAGSAWSWAAIPLIYIALVALRTGSYALFNVTPFRWLNEALSWPEVAFAGWAGLRGSVSLIMIADFLTHRSLLSNPSNEQQQLVNAEITLWTAMFVLLTLVINAPTLGPLVRLLGLNQAAKTRGPARARVKRALCSFTAAALEELRRQEGELLQGANWEAVAHYCVLSRSLESFDAPQPSVKPSQGRYSEAGGTAADGPASADRSAQGGEGEDSSGIGSEDYDAASGAGSICAEVAQGVPFLGAGPAPQDKAAGERAVPDQATQAAERPAEPAPGDLELGAPPTSRQPEAAGAGDAAEAYYCSVPAAAGAALQAQLQGALLASRQERQQQAHAASQSGSAACSAGLPASPRGEDSAASHTLTTASGRQLQQRLARQLAVLRQQQGQQAQQAGSGPASPRVPPASSSGAIEPERHAYTLSGAAGASLAAELQRQLALPRRSTQHSAASRPPLAAAYPPQRDLLGRRLARPASSSDSPRWAFSLARPGLARTPMGLSGDAAVSADASVGSRATLSPAANFLLPAVAPAAPPLAAQMELRRARTFHQGPTGLAGSAAQPAALKAAWHFMAAARSGAAADAVFPGLGAEQEAGRETSAVPPVPPVQMADLRLGLLARLQRTCHARRMQGLLSAQGLRTLEYCFNRAAERADQPLTVWSSFLAKEVQGGPGIRMLARTLVATARGYAALPRLAQRALSWPFRKLSGMLRGLLGRRLLISCEAAVEYWLALEGGLQLPLAEAASHPGLAEELRSEVEAEVAAVQRFVADREVEAPDTFQAIQSYRAAMALLRRQAGFAQELYQSGAVDAGERGEILEALGKRERRLELTGPVWKPPRPGAVLRSLPFLRCLPRSQLGRLLSQGSVRELKRGEQFWRADAGASASQGLFVVLGGAVRRRLQRLEGGNAKELFQSTGGVVGALLAATGARLPGSDTAVAEGNSLGRGPLLFHLPQVAVEKLLEGGRSGKPAAAQARLELLRLAGGYVLQHCEAGVLAAVQGLLQRQGKPSALPQSRASAPVPASASGGGRVKAPSVELAAVMELIAAQEVEEEDLGRPPTMAATAGSEGAAGASTATSGKANVAAARAWAAQVTAAMRAELHSTLLLELPPGATFCQTTHAVVLRGQLAALPPTRQPGAAAPVVLPWLADPRLGLVPGAGSYREDQEQRWWAGPEGALLLVWLTGDGRDPPGVAEAAQAAPSAAAAQPTALRYGATMQGQSAAVGGSPGRRLMPWQHPFVRRKPAQ
ncbi:hypothetical protein ABPG75_004199 [Micractinium tetrahymenae]